MGSRGTSKIDYWFFWKKLFLRYQRHFWPQNDTSHNSGPTLISFLNFAQWNGPRDQNYAYGFSAKGSSVWQMHHFGCQNDMPSELWIHSKDFLKKLANARGQEIHVNYMFFSEKNLFGAIGPFWANRSMKKMVFLKRFLFTLNEAWWAWKWSILFQNHFVAFSETNLGQENDKMSCQWYETVFRYYLSFWGMRMAQLS